ncbi:hypothetical protein [Leptolyngbya sp. GGD]|uniref:hypothetical protein n=1 Tax=Leptolyngbya sp. GGD TaxID=2997907 RepID=UPI00227AFA62|nr:hypothetical protein [Leptolyngbya sp. GGD]MCY6492555.1 hypothetical protein [Leptolyngbya sp. GGD]
MRAKIIQVLQAKAPQQLSVGFIQGHYEASNPPRLLDEKQLRDIMIELSSPLTGFVGRKESDRFYFLRPFQ